MSPCSNYQKQRERRVRPRLKRVPALYGTALVRSPHVVAPFMGAAPLSHPGRSLAQKAVGGPSDIGDASIGQRGTYEGCHYKRLGSVLPQPRVSRGRPQYSESKTAAVAFQSGGLP